MISVHRKERKQHLDADPVPRTYSWTCPERLETLHQQDTKVGIKQATQTSASPPRECGKTEEDGGQGVHPITLCANSACHMEAELHAAITEMED